MESPQLDVAQELRFQILRWLGRDYLAIVCDSYKLIVSDRRSYESYIKAIEQAQVPMEQILQPLSRDELKLACGILQLDPSGREKSVLIERIVAVLTSPLPKGKKKSDRITAESKPRSEALLAHRTSGPEVNRRRVFLVHGHDDLLKLEVARFTETLNLQPIILAEQPNLGRTIIEKFESHAESADFAIILLTPDDIGAAKSESTRPRARQNVILELGYFIGKLGRNRVCALYKGGVEIPSDVLGVVYVSVEGDWKIRLAKEMKAANIPIDLNLVV